MQERGADKLLLQQYFKGIPVKRLIYKVFQATKTTINDLRYLDDEIASYVSDGPV